VLNPWRTAKRRRIFVCVCMWCVYAVRVDVCVCVWEGRWKVVLFCVGGGVCVYCVVACVVGWWLTKMCWFFCLFVCYVMCLLNTHTHTYL